MLVQLKDASGNFLALVAQDIRSVTVVNDCTVVITDYGTWSLNMTVTDVVDAVNFVLSMEV